MRDFNFYFKEIGEVGYVKSIISSIFYVEGIPSAKVNELVISESGAVGIVRAILPELAEVMIFEGQSSIIHNMRVVRTNEVFWVTVRDNYFGRIINSLGVPQDNLGPIGEGKLVLRQADPPAPDIDVRVRVSKPLETGVMAVDMQVPIGRGQRELVLGDQKTGKTTFALQALVNQAKQGAACVYVSIGKKKSDLKFVEDYLADMGVLKKTIIVAASSSDPPPMVYLAPFTGMAIAEHFRDRGQDVLVVLDDLATHAKFYREISLLSRRPPGRQSYPGDIFHLHARLSERAGNIRLADGKVASITLLPIGETLESDLAGYIQTNLMAMTDGHIFFDLAESKKGRHPAVSFTLSVSRVGTQTKTPLEREVSAEISRVLAEARKAEELGRFGIELTAQTQETLKISEKLETIFNQESQVIIPKALQLILLGLFLGKFWDEKTATEIRGEKTRLLNAFNLGKLKTVVEKINDCQTLQDLTTLVAKNLKILSPTLKSAPKEAPVVGKPAMGTTASQ